MTEMSVSKYFNDTLYEVFRASICRYNKLFVVILLRA